MTNEFANEEFNASFTLPEPFSGNHWNSYEAAREHSGESGEGQIIQLARAALAVIESGTYKYNGDTYDLREKGMDAPLEILVWLGITVNHWAAERLAIPKDLYGNV